MSDELKIAVPNEVLEAIARRAAEFAASDQADEPEPFIDVKEAAQHLACRPHRIYDLVHRRAIPFYKDGSRLLFRRSELDGWITGDHSRSGPRRPNRSE